MAQKTERGRAERTLLQVKLNKDQIEEVEKVTGVRLSTLDVISLSGDAARSVSNELVSAIAVVACW